MAKKFTLIDRLLIGIALVDEVLDETLWAGYRAYRAGKLGPWSPPGYKGTALKQNIYRLLKTGYLEKVIENGEPILKITRGGKYKLSRRFSFFKLRQKNWDGYWRLVIFDISEKQKLLREKLRRKLKELNFGQWQKSIYISPFSLEEDMKEFLDAEHLTGMAYVLTAKHNLLGDARDLAGKVWQVNNLNNSYYKILEDLKQSKPMDKIYQHLLEIIEEDPCLPRQLLPENWMGEIARFKVIKTMKEIK